jgi:TetR/AcrR family transcriptional regulator
MVKTVDSVRARIIAEATRLFAERGYAGTSIEAISVAAGITRPTLVYHFGSKAGLRDAVFEGLMAHWRDELPRLMAAAAAGGPRLESLTGAMFDFFRREPALARLLLREVLDRPRALADGLRAHLQPITGLLTAAVRAGQAQGALKPEVDPEAFVVVVISAALGVVAVGETAGALVAPEPSIDAQQAELVRVAHAALLAPRTREEH